MKVHSEHSFAAYALVMLRKDDHILLLKRSPDARFGQNCYSLIGGRVEKGETFRDTLVREVFEEIGVTVDPADLYFVHTFYRQGATNSLVAVIFECTSWDGEPVNKEPKKHTDMTWFSLNELPENMLPAHYGALELIKQKIAYSEQQPS